MSWLNKLLDLLRQKLPSREKLIESIPLILVILYLYGVLIHTVQAGISRTFSTEPPSGPVLDWSAATALSTVFSPFGFLFTVIMAGLVFLFTDKFRQWLSGEKLERDRRGFEILYDGLHGTSGWMGKDEQREILQIGPVSELADFPIGKLDEGSQKFAALKDAAYMSGHTIVYGASGSGKTRGCTLPLLMKKIAEGKESLIIVDPKGDLFERTYKFAVENRYTVRALNLLDLDHSDGFNCFDDVERDSSLVSIIAEAIMATTSNKLEREDFWGKAEKNLLMALILYVATLRDQRTGELLPIHERGLGEIYRILSTESFADIDDRFAQLPATHPAQSPYYHLQMPRWLFADSRYKLLALESKVAYTFLLNRFQLSRMNGWINDAGEVFIIFTRQELADEMQISFRKAIECFQELVSAKLIWERRMGRGYPNQIYLAAVQLSQEDAQAHTSAPFDKKTRHADSAHLESCQTCGNDTSRDAKMAHLDMPKPQASNTERIQIREERPSLSQTDEDELREILGSCELHLFQRQTAGVFQHAVTRLFYAEQWWLDHSQLPRSVIRQTLHSLDGSILQAVERKLQENTQQQIQNTMAYTMTVILNEVWECEADLLLDPELNRTMEFSANMKEGFP
ncbi:replication initiator protein A [Ruthenibacterium lactatiformans]|uniref:replication initiator protein A n=1 Tax=Ruthenibacterium lactatiformans TaxID=1550024 RepID=UPI0039F55648